MSSFEEYVNQAGNEERQRAQEDQAIKRHTAERIGEMVNYLGRAGVAALPIFSTVGSSTLQTTTIKTGWFSSEKKHVYVSDHKRLENDGWLIMSDLIDETQYAQILTTNGLVLNVRNPHIARSPSEDSPKIDTFPAIVCSKTEVEDFFLPGIIHNPRPGSFSDCVRILGTEGDQLTYMQRPEWKHY